MFESVFLNEILKSELTNRNVILEKAEWLPKCHRLIILKYRFSEQYSLATYREVNDTHYWLSEYVDGNECLACKFEVLN